MVTKLLTIKDVAEQLHVSLSTVRRLGLPTVHIGGSLRFQQDDIDSYIQSNKKGGNSYGVRGHTQRQRKRKVEVPHPSGFIPRSAIWVQEPKTDQKIDGTKQYRGKGGRFTGSAMGMPRPDED